MSDRPLRSRGTEAILHNSVVDEYCFRRVRDASPFDICGHRIVDVRTAYLSWKDFQRLLRLPERRSADKIGVT